MRGIHQQLIACLAVVAALSVFTATASAVMVYPGPFVGSNVTYTAVTESSADPINDPEPLYGAPTLLPANILDFNPSANAFSVDAPPPDNTDGSLSFIVTSNTASPVSTLVVNEGGDYQFLGSSPSGELVAATLFVTIRDINTDAIIAQKSDSFFELFDAPVLEKGFWTNSVSIDLTPYNLTEFKVVINNLLQASANSGSTAFLRKKEFQVDVPEPATALLALAGLGLIAGGRRRSA